MASASIEASLAVAASIVGYAMRAVKRAAGRSACEVQVQQLLEVLKVVLHLTQHPSGLHPDEVYVPILVPARLAAVAAANVESWRSHAGDIDLLGRSVHTAAYAASQAHVDGLSSPDIYRAKLGTHRRAARLRHNIPPTALARTRVPGTTVWTALAEPRAQAVAQDWPIGVPSEAPVAGEAAAGVELLRHAPGSSIPPPPPQVAPAKAAAAGEATDSVGDPRRVPAPSMPPPPPLGQVGPWDDIKGDEVEDKREDDVKAQRDIFGPTTFGPPNPFVTNPYAIGFGSTSARTSSSTSRSIQTPQNV